MFSNTELQMVFSRLMLTSCNKPDEINIGKCCDIAEVGLLSDESPGLHHSEPGTEASDQREPCYTAGFEEFLSVHISKAYTVIGLI